MEEDKMNECCDPQDDTAMPNMYLNHDLENYYAQVEMPGVKKEDVTLEVSVNGLCIRGKKGDKDVSGCWMLAHQVNVDKVEAKYNEGLLDIRLPFKNPMTGGKKIDIR
jgi:HSP20 family protein